MKTFIRKFLNIQITKKDLEGLQETQENLKRDISFIGTKLNKLTKVKCYLCKKTLIPNLNPIYTNFQGQKFCSYDCIDKNNVKEKGKQ